MSTAERLLADIEAFLKRTGMPATEMGLRVLKDGHFVHRLRQGRDITTRTLDRVRDFMADYEAKSRKTPKQRAAARAA